MTQRSRAAWLWWVVCVAACGSTGPEVQGGRDASDDARSVDATADAIVEGDAASADAVVSDAFTTDASLMRVVCDGPGAVAPDVPVVAPDRATYLAAIANVAATSNPPTTFAVDPNDCSALLWDVYLPLGSAFAHVIPNSDGRCSVWLGGEEEDPEYNGMPRSYCRFDRSCRPMEIATNLAGPASIDSPWCVPAGFCTHHCTE